LADCKDEVTVYDLVAVICHHGTAGGNIFECFDLSHICIFGKIIPNGTL